ncbi:MAG: hypothetical protein HRU19_20345 [Pseudobacteriovorax sp.]|nr:hypothetical protein [Pseudobacteriovorax sp.]
MNAKSLAQLILILCFSMSCVSYHPSSDLTQEIQTDKFDSKDIALRGILFAGVFQTHESQALKPSLNHEMSQMGRSFLAESDRKLFKGFRPSIVKPELSEHVKQFRTVPKDVLTAKAELPYLLFVNITKDESRFDETYRVVEDEDKGFFSRDDYYITRKARRTFDVEYLLLSPQSGEVVWSANSFYNDARVNRYKQYRGLFDSVVGGALQEVMHVDKSYPSPPSMSHMLRGSLRKFRRVMTFKLKEELTPPPSARPPRNSPRGRFAG